jgi:hypothetical protein
MVITIITIISRTTKLSTSPCTKVFRYRGAQYFRVNRQYPTRAVKMMALLWTYLQFGTDCAFRWHLKSSMIWIGVTDSSSNSEYITSLSTLISPKKHLKAPLPVSPPLSTSPTTSLSSAPTMAAARPPHICAILGSVSVDSLEVSAVSNEGS